MKISSGVKPAVWGAVGGAIAWWVVLAFVFGWSSAGTAQKQAAHQSETAVVAVLAPICADRFLAQPDVARKKSGAGQSRDLAPSGRIPEGVGHTPGRLLAGYDPRRCLLSDCA